MPRKFHEDRGSMRTDHPIFKVIGTYVCTIKYPDFNMLAMNINFDHKHSISLRLWVYLPVVCNLYTHLIVLPYNNSTKVGIAALILSMKKLRLKEANQFVHGNTVMKQSWDPDARSVLSRVYFSGTQGSTILSVPS